MRLETTMEMGTETVEMSAALDRVMVAAGYVTNEQEKAQSLDSIFSDLSATCLAKRGRDVEDEDESDDEEEEDDDEDLDDEEDFDDEDEDEDEEEEEFEEGFDDDDLDDDDDIFYDDDDDE